MASQKQLAQQASYASDVVEEFFRAPPPRIQSSPDETGGPLGWWIIDDNGVIVRVDGPPTMKCPPIASQLRDIPTRTRGEEIVEMGFPLLWEFARKYGYARLAGEKKDE